MYYYHTQQFHIGIPISTQTVKRRKYPKPNAMQTTRGCVIYTGLKPQKNVYLHLRIFYTNYIEPFSFIQNSMQNV